MKIFFKYLFIFENLFLTVVYRNEKKTAGHYISKQHVFPREPPYEQGICTRKELGSDPDMIQQG